MIDYWHNPRCSKSRAGLALLQDRAAALTVRRYLDDPPTRAEIETARAALGLAPIDMIRTGEKVFRDLGLTRDSSDDALLDAMAAHPILIERPLAILGDRAIIGRPPERLLDLL
ncbi:arsenate reductase (glutaredoxin) [Pukyongiella litopenaei]|uniref:Arsenate reductase n=1 Tax=Pukyongiella litopenaei TaxID=2605946 RepID=A0A2S0MTX1_9RHOB|nr:arsenate reductase (glutaredoxin) [Pukyongiella litopenaei]AVO39344.1 arsenate reductase (glutaredoxin) [Pukyongiella litopenaei]